MTAEARRRPRRVARVARHRAVRVRERVRCRDQSPRRPVTLDCLRAPRLVRVVRCARRDRIDRLHDFPFQIRIQHGPLEERVPRKELAGLTRQMETQTAGSVSWSKDNLSCVLAEMNVITLVNKTVNLGHCGNCYSKPSGLNWQILV